MSGRGPSALARLREERGSGPGGSLFELVVIVVVALGLALGIQAFIVKPYRIPSPSMVPTLVEKQRILVNRLGNRLGDPEVGDVVVFHPPVGAERSGDMCGSAPPEGQACVTPTPEQAGVNFVKRVVAGPGDRLAIERGHVILNGRQQKEPFIRQCGDVDGCDYREPITIPADHYFMMGDNRGASDDSRFWGPVPRDWIIGVAFATYWPPNRIGLL